MISIPENRAIAGEERGGGAGSPAGRSSWWNAYLAEWSLAWLVCAAFAAVAAPDINESHYLTKARHFWDRDWCRGDLFLESSDAQWLFFAGTGWLTRFVSLDAFAWTGRCFSWAAMAAAFVFLSRTLQVRGWAVPAALTLLLTLNRAGHMAGEWVVGGFEAKTLAWPLVLAGLAFFCRGKTAAAALCCAVAAAVHFVVGWWGLVGCLFGHLAGQLLDWKFRPRGKTGLIRSNWRNPAFAARTAGVSAMVLAGLMIGAFPSVAADWHVPAADADRAAMVQSLVRLPHHVYFGGFSIERIAAFSAIVLLWTFLSLRGFRRQPAPFQRFTLFAAVSLAIGWTGLLLSALLQTHESAAAARLLRLYWFRIEDVAVPLGISLQLGFLLDLWRRQGSPRHRQIATAAIAVLVLAAVLEAGSRAGNRISPSVRVGISGLESDPGRIAAIDRNWRAVCEWARTQTPRQALFVTHPNQQTFHWLAERAEVFARKHAPQDARGLLEWQRRMVWMEAVWKTGPHGTDTDLAMLAEAMQHFGADYAVVDQRSIDLSRVPEGLTRVYPVEPSRRTSFCILRMDRMADRPHSSTAE